MTLTHNALAPPRNRLARCLLLALLLIVGAASLPALAATEGHISEVNLVLPDLADTSLVSFLGGISGATLLSYGLVVAIAGLAFGAVIYSRIRRLPVHRSMAEISELIYETCKTYMLTQGKFLLILQALTAVIMIGYFYFVQQLPVSDVATILAFSVIGIAGSFGVAWFGIRINTLANSRTAFASLVAKPYQIYAIPITSGISIGMLLISTELLIMLCIMLFIPASLAGKCFIGFAIGESLGAAALRIAGGIFTKIADIGSDLMKIEFGIQEDDARNPG
ncbi:MAG: sodium/proton-translocating pyrophosphatase, partial [Candidatus Accumulibacter sp.]|nr:sodium/proton-translocating pyrophosphatase [Accumulibacter sp.]